MSTTLLKVLCQPPTEIMFNSIVRGLFAEGSMPPGDVVDAGAHDGQWSCMYSMAAPTRLVHAIEPLEGNVRKIRALRAAHPFLQNVRPLVGALGNRSRWLDAGAAKRTGQVNVTGLREVERAAGAAAPVRVYRLDEMFVDANSSHPQGAGAALGFLHLDVEGRELDVLHSGVRTLSKWQPMFTVEVHVHADPAYTVALLELIARLGYDMFVVEEPCGIRMDCRNLLCVPASRISTLLRSATLDLAVSSRVLLAVDAATILSHAYPCCRSHLACCPLGPVEGGSCCSPHRIQEWRQAQNLTNADTPRPLRRAERFTAASWWRQRGQRFGRADHVMRWQD